MKTRILIITVSVILILFAFYEIFNLVSDVQQPSSVIPNVTILRGSDTMEHNLSPDKIIITVGRQVTWFNDDNTSHWIDADDGSWSSGLISPQNYFTKKFENAGIYTYHGKPWIRGTVIVSEKHNELDDSWITVTPETRSIITVQDKPVNRTIVPITITEMTTVAQSLDTITHWNFSLLGIEMATLNKYWGNLANQYITSEMVDQNGDDVLDYSRIPEGMIFYKLSLFYYPATCEDGTKITGEGGYPEPIPIKKGADSVFFKSGSIGLYPDDNEKYFFDFVSGFETDVEFHPNIHVISQETKKCKLDTNQRNFTDVYYTNAVFDFKN